MKHPHNRLIAAWLLVGCFLYTLAIGQDVAVQQYSDAGQKALATRRLPRSRTGLRKAEGFGARNRRSACEPGTDLLRGKKIRPGDPGIPARLKLKPSLAKTEVFLAMSLSEVNRYQEALPGLEKGFRGSFDPEMKRLCGLQLERAYTGLIATATRLRWDWN